MPLTIYLRHLLPAGLLLLIVLSGCEREQESAEITDVPVEVRKEITLPESVSGGFILSAAKRDSCRVSVVEFRSRLVKTVDFCTGESNRVSRVGTEVSEFERPYRLVEFNGKLGLSDRERNEFLIFDRDDNFYKLLPYDDAPGRLVSYSTESPWYYHTDSGMYLMSRVHQETMQRDRYFLLPQPFQTFSIRVPGGGIQRIGDKIYTISSLMPYIYVFDEQTEEVSYLLPDFMKHSENTRTLPDIDFDDQGKFMEELNRYQQYLNLYQIQFDDEPHLLIHYSHQGNYHIAIVDTQGETRINQPSDYFIAGTFGNALIGVEMTSQRVFLLDFTMSNNQ